MAFAVIRVEPTMWEIGTAAGIAAAIASNSDIPLRDVDIEHLQLALKKQGVPIRWPPNQTCNFASESSMLMQEQFGWRKLPVYKEDINKK